MGAGHGHKLHYHGHSVVHRAPSHVKLATLLVFMLVVVATPRTWFPAFGLYLAVVVGVIALSGVPFGYIGRRMVVELPFVVFALLWYLWGVESRQPTLNSGASLLAFLRERLADFKLPRRAHVLPGLPRNATGKILKTALRERLASGDGPREAS